MSLWSQAGWGGLNLAVALYVARRRRDTPLDPGWLVDKAWVCLITVVGLVDVLASLVDCAFVTRAVLLDLITLVAGVIMLDYSLWAWKVMVRR